MPLRHRHPLHALFFGVLCLMIGCLLWIQAGLGQLVTELVEVDGGCGTSCPGDDDDGHCPPGCDKCACCPTVLPAILTGALAPLPVPDGAVDARPGWTTAAPPEAPGAPIWRPPRATA